MKPTDRITDFTSGTGDHLREVIPMLGLETNNISKQRCGDGVIVVLSKEEGSQEPFIKKRSSSLKSRLNPLLNTSVGIYYPLLFRKKKYFKQTSK